MVWAEFIFLPVLIFSAQFVSAFLDICKLLFDICNYIGFFVVVFSHFPLTVSSVA